MTLLIGNQNPKSIPTCNTLHLHFDMIVYHRASPHSTFRDTIKHTGAELQCNDEFPFISPAKKATCHAKRRKEKRKKLSMAQTQKKGENMIPNRNSHCHSLVNHKQAPDHAHATRMVSGNESYHADNTKQNRFYP